MSQILKRIADVFKKLAQNAITIDLTLAVVLFGIASVIEVILSKRKKEEKNNSSEPSEGWL